MKINDEPTLDQLAAAEHEAREAMIEALIDVHFATYKRDRDRAFLNSKSCRPQFREAALLSWCRSSGELRDALDRLDRTAPQLAEARDIHHRALEELRGDWRRPERITRPPAPTIEEHARRYFIAARAARNERRVPRHRRQLHTAIKIATPQPAGSNHTGERALIAHQIREQLEKTGNFSLRVRLCNF
jgi:hypothetical protein